MSKHILFFILLIFSNEVSAMSPIKEIILIRNYSSRIVTITREYRDDPSRIINIHTGRTWRQTIHGINLTFTDLSLNLNEISILPNRARQLIDYYPMGNIDGYEAYTRLDQIPFMDKMTSIFSSLRIATEDGQRVITLENLGEQIIKKNIAPGGTAYILEIFDYDFEGRPASEW